MTTYDTITDAFYAHVDDLVQHGHQQPLTVTDRCLVQWFAAWLCGRYDVTPAANPITVPPPIKAEDIFRMMEKLPPGTMAVFP